MYVTKDVYYRQPKEKERTTKRKKKDGITISIVEIITQLFYTCTFIITEQRLDSPFRKSENSNLYYIQKRLTEIV